MKARKQPKQPVGILLIGCGNSQQVTSVQGDLPEPIHADDVIWTLEDRKLLQICIPKSLATADHCWRSLLLDQYIADPITFDNMQKKLTLQKFQLENPGFDFSGAEVTGNYQKGGPDLPT